MARYPSPAPSNTSDSEDEAEEFELEQSTSYFLDRDATVIAQPQPHTPAQSQWDNQLSFLSLSDRAPHRSVANTLPHEILIHVFKHLVSTSDLHNSLLVCRAWCQCSVELLWHKPQFSKLASLFKMLHVISRSDQIFNYATFIRRLNFVELAQDLTDQLFVRIATCERLERLTLVGCTLLSDESISKVVTSCPSLVTIDLTNVCQVTDKSIIDLALSSPKLQGINLGNCKEITDAAVLALAENCPHLRRIKLYGIEAITDEPIRVLALNCPLLLEVDLNQCPRVTDRPIRDLWERSYHLREFRLSGLVSLTDAAFPVPPLAPSGVSDVVNPFPYNSTSSSPTLELPPLILPKPFDHLRLLDLTSCMHLTDDAIDGIISNTLKIRHLVLARCSSLTDNALFSISKLGRNLHYLHLGHVSNITDRGVTALARSCVRLRYIDLAACINLTDLSVHEISALSKLRRIGLVRVTNLTDQGVFALAERHHSLERIHLSYCESITVSAIHHLLQKLPRMTHLSLTGIPAFRRKELQTFCRAPPKEFNANQRAAFCVYSGKGITDLRKYLQTLASMADRMSDRMSENDSDDDTATIGPPPVVPGAWPEDTRPFYPTHLSNGQSSTTNGSNGLGLAFLSQPNINLPSDIRAHRHRSGGSQTFTTNPDRLLSATHLASSEPATPRDSTIHALQQTERRNGTSRSLVRAALTPASGTMTPEDPSMAGPGPTTVSNSNRRIRRRGDGRNEEGVVTNGDGGSHTHISRLDSASAPPPADRTLAQQYAQSHAQHRSATPSSGATIGVVDDRDLDRELEQSVQAALGGTMSSNADPEVARGRARVQRSAFRSRAEQYASVLFGRGSNNNNSGNNGDGEGAAGGTET
ncbi:hypothetical protein BOTBODRAFT_158249 [Botryobasidium botryosum FD-172 SS1]|uniref:Uncharacterized protein n=1 Tax=Botryobasidium botryosum (strain FD-172 SS1) TaxID=930990 RepID=A0A067ML26_BOTB1|nr:hypothetical protein BOTBODRAFT_158249 [Botryobasidium botryosum FD-172 SS1]